MFTRCCFYFGSTHHIYIIFSPIQKCSTLTLRVNIKNISFVHLLAIYLKFNAPSFIFHSTRKFLLQKELLGCKKNNGQKSHVKKERERERKIYKSKFTIKFSS